MDENQIIELHIDLGGSKVVTASAGAGGAISPSGAVSVDYGAGQTFTITPDEGFAIANVLVDGSSVGAVAGYSFSNVTADHTIDVSFTPISYTITASAGNNGSISPAGQTEIVHGVDRTFTITPDSGYAIADVRVDGVSVGPTASYSFNQITGDHTLEASFTPVPHEITTDVGIYGSLFPSGRVTVYHGADQTFTITPAKGCAIADVVVDGVSVGTARSYTFSGVTGDHTLKARFKQITYMILTPIMSNGSISPRGPVRVSHGADQTFTITPRDGYAIDDVRVDGGSVGAVSSYTLHDITKNHTIKVAFKPDEFTIAAQAGAGGRLTPSGDVRAPADGGVTFIAIPDPGCVLDDVAVDGESIGAAAAYTFENITGDHAIEAVFDCAGPFHVITSVAGPGGCISPSGDIRLKEGADKSFTITPGSGYRIEEVTVDGIPAPADSGCIFENIASDHVIRASFAPDGQTPPEILPDIKANGSDGPIFVSSTEPVSITINLAPGHKEGANADWWIAAQMSGFDPAYLFYTHPGRWSPEIARAIEWPLTLVENMEVSSVTLPPGDYIFYFAVDDNADDDADAVWWDSVDVHVR